MSCPVENHPKQARIVQYLQAGMRLDRIAARCAIPLTALLRHLRYGVH